MAINYFSGNYYVLNTRNTSKCLTYQHRNQKLVDYLNPSVYVVENVPVLVMMLNPNRHGEYNNKHHLILTQLLPQILLRSYL